MQQNITRQHKITIHSTKRVIPHTRYSKITYLIRNRRRKHKRLSIRTYFRQYTLYLLTEAHFKQRIRFIENLVLYTLQAILSLF